MSYKETSFTSCRRNLQHLAGIWISYIIIALKRNMKTTATHWYVYMVSCADSSIYTGITTDLQRRLQEHNSPRGGARYTRSRQPVILVYYEEYPDRSLASKREFHLKKLSPGRKRALVTSTAVE